jgi:hypothetical protein
MSTFVSVNTYTYSVAYVTDKMLTSLKWIILWSGLDPDKLICSWDSLERGIKTWLRSRHLEVVTLEVYRPISSTLVGRWDFDIVYSFESDGDGGMWVDTDTIRYAIRKTGVDPHGCTYRIVVHNKPGRADVEGWGPAEYLSTSGFLRQSVGTAIGTDALASRVSYWRRT